MFLTSSIPPVAVCSSEEVSRRTPGQAGSNIAASTLCGEYDSVEKDGLLFRGFAANNVPSDHGRTEHVLLSAAEVLSSKRYSLDTTSAAADLASESKTDGRRGVGRVRQVGGGKSRPSTRNAGATATYSTASGGGANQVHANSLPPSMQGAVASEGVDPFQTAVLLLAHLDRLAAPFHLPLGTYPSLFPRCSSPPAADTDTPFVSKVAQSVRVLGGVRLHMDRTSAGQGTVGVESSSSTGCTSHLYAVDVSKRTFELILSLLDMLSRAADDRDCWTGCSPHWDKGRAHEARIVPYMILSCLRVLRANLAQLLCGRGWDNGDAELMCLLSRIKGRMLRFVLTGVVEADADTMNAEGFDGGFDIAAKHIRTEATDILMVGLAVFYPSPGERVGLLVSVMGQNEASSQSNKLVALIRTEQLDLSPGVVQSDDEMLYVLQFHLLQPLLKRLTEEEFMADLFRFHYGRPVLANGPADGFPASNGSITPCRATCASEPNTVTMLGTALVDLVAKDTDLELSYITKRRDGDEAQGGEYGDVRTDAPKTRGRQRSWKAMTRNGLPGNVSQSELERAPRISAHYVRMLVTLQKHTLSWAGCALEDEQRELSADAAAAHDSARALELDALVNSWTTLHDHGPPESSAARGSGAKGRCSIGEANSLAGNEHVSNMSWIVFLRYASLLMRSCQATLDEASRVLDPSFEEDGKWKDGAGSEEWGRCTANISLDREREGERDDALAEAVVSCLARSLVGGVLPSLATCLSSFARTHHVASALLPTVAELLCSLDRLASLLPAVADCDRAYLARKAATGLVHNAGSQVTELPWILELEKTLAFVAGQFASTLVVGDKHGHGRTDCSSASETEGSDVDLFVRCLGLSQTVPAPPKRDPSNAAARGRSSLHPYFDDPCFAFISGPLIRGSLEGGARRACREFERVRTSERVPVELCAQLDHLEPSAEVATPLRAPVSRAMSLRHKVNRAELSGRGLLAEERRAFLIQIIAGEGGGAVLVKRLRKVASSHNASYRMSLRQARNHHNDLDMINRSERAMCAVVLKHAGLIPQALAYVEALQQCASKGRAHDGGGGTLEAVLLKAWGCAGTLRAWLLQQRSQLLSLNAHASSKSAAVDTDDVVSFSVFSGRILKRALFLLCFQVDHEALQDSLSVQSDAISESGHKTRPCLCSDPPMMAGHVDATHARYDDQPFLVRFPKSRWRRVRMRVHILARWRRLPRACEAGDEIGSVGRGALSFVKCDSGVLLERMEGDRGGAFFDPLTAQVLQQVLDNERRARAREQGLRYSRRLLGGVSFESAQIDILRTMPAALRLSNKTGGHCLTHLEGSHWRLHRRVHGAFLDLLAVLASIISRASGGITNTNGSRDIDCRANTDVGNVNGVLLMVAMECWGIGLRDPVHEWPFLASTDLLASLRRIVSYKPEHDKRGVCATVPGNIGAAALSNGRALPGGTHTGLYDMSSGGSISAPRPAGIREQIRTVADRLFHLIVVQVGARIVVHRSLGMQYRPPTWVSTTNDGAAAQIGFPNRLATPLAQIFNVILDEAVCAFEELRVSTAVAEAEASSSPFDESNTCDQIADGLSRSSDQRQLMMLTDTIGRGVAARGKEHDRAGVSLPVNASRRRSQELIGRARHFISSEEGLVVPGDKLLCSPFMLQRQAEGTAGSDLSAQGNDPFNVSYKTLNGGCFDFSMTLWLKITQAPASGDQVVMLRGHRQMCCPLIVLRATDRRLEMIVTTTTKPGAQSVERLLSKTAITMNRWTHIAVAFEGLQCRLYLDGALDHSRTLSGAADPRRYPLYMGKLPEFAHPTRARVPRSPRSSGGDNAAGVVALSSDIIPGEANVAGVPAGGAARAASGPPATAAGDLWWSQTDERGVADQSNHAEPGSLPTAAVGMGAAESLAGGEIFSNAPIIRSSVEVDRSEDRGDYDVHKCAQGIGGGMPQQLDLKGGIEGSMAKLGYHTRALSDIHVRIVFEQGPPVDECVADEKMFNLLVLLRTIVHQPAVKQQLVDKRWLEWLLSIVTSKASTQRVKQVTFRVLRRVLPHVGPEVVSEVLGRAMEFSKLANNGESLVNRLLSMAGEALWRGSTVEHSEPLANGSAKTNAETVVPPSCVGESAAKEKNKRHEGQVEGKAHDIACRDMSVGGLVHTTLNGSFTVEKARLSSEAAAEMINMLRHIAHEASAGAVIETAALQGWRTLLSESLVASLNGLLGFLQATPDTADNGMETRKARAIAIAGLGLAGGLIEDLRPGGRVAMLPTSLPAVLMHGADHVSGMIYESGTIMLDVGKTDGSIKLPASREEGPQIWWPPLPNGGTMIWHQRQSMRRGDDCSAPCASAESIGHQFKTLHVKTNELVPLDETLVPSALVACCDDDDLGSQRRSSRFAEVLTPLLQHVLQHKSHEGIASRGSFTSVIQSRLLRVAYGLVSQKGSRVDGAPPCDRTMEWSKHFVRSGLLPSLLDLALCCPVEKKWPVSPLPRSQSGEDGGGLLRQQRGNAMLALWSGPLADAERIVTELRQRLFQLQAADDRQKHAIAAAETQRVESSDITNGSFAGALGLGGDDSSLVQYSAAFKAPDMGPFVNEVRSASSGDVRNCCGKPFCADIDCPHVLASEGSAALLQRTRTDQMEEDNVESAGGGDGSCKDRAAAPRGSVAESIEQLQRMLGMSVEESTDMALNPPPSDMVQELMAMGFPESWCVVALQEREHDMVNASAWIVDNLDMLSTLTANPDGDSEQDKDSLCDDAYDANDTDEGGDYGAHEEDILMNGQQRRVGQHATAASEEDGFLQPRASAVGDSHDAPGGSDSAAESKQSPPRTKHALLSGMESDSLQRAFGQDFFPNDCCIGGGSPAAYLASTATSFVGGTPKMAAGAVAGHGHGDTDNSPPYDEGHFGGFDAKTSAEDADLGQPASVGLLRGLLDCAMGATLEELQNLLEKAEACLSSQYARLAVLSILSVLCSHDDDDVSLSRDASVFGSAERLVALVRLLLFDLERYAGQGQQFASLQQDGCSPAQAPGTEGSPSTSKSANSILTEIVTRLVRNEIRSGKVLKDSRGGEGGSPRLAGGAGAVLAEQCVLQMERIAELSPLDAGSGLFKGNMSASTAYAVWGFELLAKLAWPPLRGAEMIQRVSLCVESRNLEVKDSVFVILLSIMRAIPDSSAACMDTAAIKSCKDCVVALEASVPLATVQELFEMSARHERRSGRLVHSKFVQHVLEFIEACSSLRRGYDVSQLENMSTVDSDVGHILALHEGGERLQAAERTVDGAASDMMSGRIHSGISCTSCGMCPIRGTRFRGLVCGAGVVELCGDCEAEAQVAWVSAAASACHGRAPSVRAMLEIRDPLSDGHGPRGDALLEVARPLVESVLRAAAYAPFGDGTAGDNCRADFSNGLEFVLHDGVTCSLCGTSPLVGVRYMCANCPSYDLCQGCMANELKVQEPWDTNVGGTAGVDAHCTSILSHHTAQHVFVKLVCPLVSLRRCQPGHHLNAAAPQFTRTALLPVLYPQPHAVMASPTIARVSRHALCVKWDSAVSRGLELVGYEVEVRGPRGRRLWNLPPRATQHSLADLDAGLSYACRVRAVCSRSPAPVQNATIAFRVGGASEDRAAGLDEDVCAEESLMSSEVVGVVLCRGPWGPAVHVTTPEEIGFHFDKVNSGASIKISNGGLTATFGSSESWATVLGSTGFLVGRNRWEIRIDRSPTAYLFVGVASRDANLSTFLGGDSHGWGYIGDRALYHKRNKVKVYGERFSQGDIIGVTLDMDEGTLSFSKNGVELGVAMENMTGVLYPAVAFYNRGQRVTLVKHAFSCPGAGLPVPGSPSSVSVDDVVATSHVVRAMSRSSAPRGDAGQTHIPRPFLRAAYREYVMWRAGRIRRFRTQSGFEMDLDISAEACAVFGLSPGDRVRTASGVSVVQGVVAGKLWRKMESTGEAEEHSERVWFFNRRELAEHHAQVSAASVAHAAQKHLTHLHDMCATLKSPKFHGPSQNNAVMSAETKESVDEKEEKYADDASLVSGAGGSSARSATPPSHPGGSAGPALTEAQFVECVVSSNWVPEVDAALVAALTELCESDVTSRIETPSCFNATPAQLAANVLQPVRVAMRRALRSLGGEDETVLGSSTATQGPMGTVAGTGIKAALALTTGGGDEGVVLAGGASILPETPYHDVIGGGTISQSALEARFGLLRAYNTCVVGALPFVDLAGSYLHPLHDQSASGGCLLDSPVPIGLAIPRAATQQDGLGETLCRLRGSLFIDIKRTLLKTAMQRTVTRAKKAEDDYDYPEDLPQVILNRPRAIIAREHPDREMRLSCSVFGQAFDELHFMEPSALRMAYTHPMDDGQERTFKVKFEGEGVDDYGGPYRECFAQFCAELQLLEGQPSLLEGSIPGMVEHEAVAGPAGLRLRGRQRGRPASSALPGPDSDAQGDTMRAKPHRCVLPLLIPTRNYQNGTGDWKPSFVPVPEASREGSAARHVYKEMFVFIGQVMGMALRSRVHLDLHFPSMVWKVCVGQPLCMTDLDGMDVAASTVLRGVLSLHSQIVQLRCENGALKKGARSARLDARKRELDGILSDLRWQTDLTDGTTVDLCDGGAHRQVSEDNCVEFVRTALECRLLESWGSMAAIRDGFLAVIPGAVLPLFTWQELERRVCGCEEINVDLLQVNTEYDDDVSEDEPHILMLWEVLRSFSHSDRRKFLRFVWARSHLPPTAEEFKQKFKVCQFRVRRGMCIDCGDGRG